LIIYILLLIVSSCVAWNIGFHARSKSEGKSDCKTKPPSSDENRSDLTIVK
jgi:hypothetical protein